MLNTASTRYQLTTNKLVSADVDANGIVDGAGLFYKMENGVQVVSNGTPSADSVFAGIAFSQYRAQATTNVVEEFVAPTTGSIVMGHTPVANKVIVKIDGVKATIGTVAPSAAGTVQLVGNVLTTHADDAGKKVVVCMHVNLTVAEIEAQPFMGDGVPGAAVSAQTGTVSVGQSGEFATDQYDAAADFATAKAELVLTADGIFTVGGTGAKVPGTVAKVPTADDPFLVIELRV